VVGRNSFEEFDDSILRTLPVPEEENVRGGGRKRKRRMKKIT
jgi:hypothetical protein